MGGPGSGRKKGSRNALPLGVVAAVKAAKQAEELGIKTDEAWGIILGVMRGEISGRYVRDRLSAAVFVLEQEIGKARQRVEVTGPRADGIYRAELDTGVPIRPTAAEELPN